MTLQELISKFVNIPITVMKDDGDKCTLIYRGDSRFFHPTANEGYLWVRYIAPHKDNIGEIFIMCEV